MVLRQCWDLFLLIFFLLRARGRGGARQTTYVLVIVADQLSNCRLESCPNSSIHSSAGQASRCAETPLTSLRCSSRRPRVVELPHAVPAPSRICRRQSSALFDCWLARLSFPAVCPFLPAPPAAISRGKPFLLVSRCLSHVPARNHILHTSYHVHTQHPTLLYTLHKHSYNYTRTLTHSPS